MKYLHKYGTRRNEVRRARKELYIRLSMVMAVILFFSLMILITQFRPRLTKAEEAGQPSPSLTGDPMSNPHLIRLRNDVDALLADYRESQQAENSDADSIELLEKAIQIQEKIIHSRGSEIAPGVDLDRQDEILTLYDEEMGAFLIAQSIRLEKQALQAWDSGDVETALDLIKRAEKTQREINESHPRSSNRNPARLQQIRNLVISWRTLPLAEEADSLRESALSLIGEGRFDEATRAVGEALEIQRSLNRDYRKSRYSTLARLKMFEDAALAVEVAPKIARIESKMKRAEEALVAGDTTVAFETAQEAELLHQQVMTQYSQRGSEQVNRLEEIRVLKETAASQTAYDNIKTYQTIARKALMERDLDQFNGVVSDWFRETQSMGGKFQRSKHLSELDAEEVTYLHQNRSEIAAIMELVYASILPVPDHAGLMGFRTEVSQALFESVMGTNPSSSASQLGPVESVTWEEARLFTKRLGWILGRPVSLPSEPVYRSMLGEPRESSDRNHAWSSSNSGRETKETGALAANPNGFFDLLGNVSEWIGSDSENMPSFVTAIGGSARDSAARLSTVPDDSRSPIERNRFIGFRFVVRVADSD
jgi:tetratricopeptide (TPR) repeat protein